jgi:hypothetical protein
MKLFGIEQFRASDEPQATDPKNWKWKPANPKWLVQETPFPLKGTSEVFLDSSVLIVGPETAEIGALCDQLRKLKKGFARVNVDEFQDSFSVELDLSDKGANSLGFIKIGSKKLPLDKFRSVYYEPPTSFKMLERQVSQFTNEERIYIKRWESLILDLHQFMPKAKWFPGTPQSLFDDLQRKLAELQIAKSCGFKIPNTIVTMDPKTAAAFAKSQKSGVLLRDTGTRCIFDKDTTYNYKVEKLDVQRTDWSRVQTAPTVLQEYIPKTKDYRIIQIENKTLACEIDSQASQISKTDWREYDYANVVYKPIEVSAKLKSSMIKFLKAINQRMGSFDFAVDAKGNAYFLEMNRPGAWLFIESLSGVKVRETLSKKL